MQLPTHKNKNWCTQLRWSGHPTTFDRPVNLGLNQGPEVDSPFSPSSPWQSIIDLSPPKHHTVSLTNGSGTVSLQNIPIEAGTFTAINGWADVQAL